MKRLILLAFAIITSFASFSQTADLVISKSASNSTPNVGSNVVFTITVTNNGPDAADNVVVNDALQSGFTYQLSSPTQGSWSDPNWTIGTLAAGGSASIDITVEINPSGAYSNTAGVVTSTLESDYSNNTSNTVTLTPVPQADVSITKTVNNATPNVGTNVTFTIGVANAGPSGAESVSVTDNLPTGYTFVSATPSVGNWSAPNWTVGNLADGATASMTVVATVKPTGVYNNTASISATTADPVAGNNSATANVAPVAQSDVSITKSVSNATPNVGSNITFTIDLANAGPSSASAVSVTDVLPSGYTLVSATPSVGSWSAPTWTVGAIASGGGASMTLIATVKPSGLYNNTASVSSASADPVPANNSATVNVTPVAQADLAITKTVDNATPNVGSNVTFTIEVANAGPSGAATVSVNEVLPSGYTFVSATPSVGSWSAPTWTIGSIASGASVSMTLVATVKASGVYNNTASVTSGTADPVALNNSATIAVTPGAQSDLSITKTVNSAVPNVGSNVTFTIEVSNTGPSDASAVSVTDNLPTGYTLVSATPSIGTWSAPTWTVGAIANGDNAILTLVATVKATGVYNNTATVSSATADPSAANNSATANVTPVAQADVSITKTVNNATPNVGSNITFTIGVANGGPSVASGVSVDDVLPSGYTFVSATPSVGSWSAPTWTVGALANGANANLDITATVKASGLYSNTATVGAVTADPSAGNNSAVVNVSPVAQADVSITKSVNNATPNVGSNVTFTIEVSNTGPSSAAAVAVSEALPSGYTFVSATPSVGSWSAPTWTVGTLALGGSATMTVVATVKSTGVYNNTATVSSTTADPTPGNNSSSVIVTPVAQADVSITKTVNNNVPNVGSNVTFTIEVTNAGPSDASAVSVTDNLPSGYTFVSATPSAGTSWVSPTWTVGSLASGADATLTIVASVKASGVYSNTVTLGSGTNDPVPANNSATVVVTPVAQSDLSVIKTVSSATPNVGSNVTFTIGVSNAGLSDASSVTVSDVLPTGYTFVGATPSVGSWSAPTWTIGSLASGANATMTLEATVKATGVYSNTATVGSATADPVVGNNSSTVVVTPVAQSDLSVTKTVSSATPNVGSNVTFTIEVTNVGPSSAAGVSVNDILPTGYTFVSATPSVGSWSAPAWTIGNMASGASASMTITATVKPSGVYSNTATVSSSTSDPAAGNNSATVVVNPVGQADVSITKTVSNATPNVGSNITFTIAVSNAGPSDASAVAVTDILPTGYTFISATPSVGSWSAPVWTVGTLASGANASMTITMAVKASGVYSNTATVLSGTTDPSAANNSATVSPIPVPQADLSITKTVGSATPNVGSNVTFTIEVSNVGPSSASAVSVNDVLPTGYTFVSATPSVGSWAAPNWTVGALASGGSAAMTLVATVKSTGVYNNVATVSSGTADPVVVNNSATALVTPVPQSDLSITKTVSNDNPNVGSNVTFTIGIANAGPSDASNVTVSDVLPAGYTFVSATPSSGTWSAPTWTVGALANGSSASMTLVATVKASGAYNNTATVSANTSDPNGLNNTITVNVNPSAQADLTILKTVSNATPNVGSNVTFTIKVDNVGPSDASNVAVSDVLPGGYTFVSATPSVGTWVAPNWNIGSLAKNGSATMTLVATVKASGTYTNTTSVSSTTSDPVATNNSSTVVVTPVPQTDLGIELAIDNLTPKIGVDVKFTLVVTNNGPSTANGVSVLDKLPNGYTYKSHSGDGSYASGSGIWTIGTMSLNATKSLEIISTIALGTNYANTALVSGTENDPVAANNTVTVTPTIQNSAPAAVNDTYTTAEDVTININAASGLFGNDVDADGQTLSITLFTVNSINYTPGQTAVLTQGNLTINANGSLSFVPTLNYNGTLPLITYTVTDGLENSNATVTLTVSSVNDAPVAAADLFSTTEEVQLSIDATNGLLKNDTDVDNLNLFVSQFAINSASYNAGQTAVFDKGSLIILSDGSLIFTPALNYNGILSGVSYTVSDGLLTGTNTITFTVNPVNDPPKANPDYLYTAQGTAALINVLVNDNDEDDGAFGGLEQNTLKITKQPANGTIIVLANKTISYTPHTGFFGQDEAEYEICDKGYPLPSLCSTGKIYIDVTRLSPQAMDDSVALDEDTNLEIDVLDNDIDNDIDPSTLVVIVKPANGTAVHIGSGIVRYVPNANFNGTDYLTYTVRDLTNLVSNVARVDITVNPIPDSPVSINGWYSTPENSPVVIPIYELVSDPDGDVDFSTLVIEVAALNGAISLGVNPGELLYSPIIGYAGNDSFDYSVADGTGLRSNTSTVSLQISDQAPTSFDDEFILDEDVPVALTVLVNDTDPQSNINPASLTIVTAPLNGTVMVSEEDGTIHYTPSSDFNGNDLFVYRVCDLTGYCDEARVAITILPVNDAPNVLDDSRTLAEDNSVFIDVLTNDSDVDNLNSELVIGIAIQPEFGRVQVVTNPDGIVYIPDLNYNGPDSFKYLLTDPDGLSTEATVLLEVTPVNDAPEPSDDDFGAIGLEGGTLDVLANDTDPEGNINPGSVTIVVEPEHGTTAVQPDGTVFYLPNSTYFGPDGFSYSVCDSVGACTQALAVFDVVAGNGPPNAFDDNLVLNEDQPVQFNPLLNDIDPNNNILPSTLEIVDGPFAGQIEVIDASGLWLYTPESDYFGSDSLVYRMCDSGDPALCSSATVYFTINPVNDTPRLLGDFVSAKDMLVFEINVLSNDFDVEGEMMTASLKTSSPTGYGVFSMTPEGVFEYQVNPGAYCNTDVIVYQVCDALGACAEAEIQIEIAPLDSDGDGIPDFIESTRDTDGDNTQDKLSDDSDGDGIPDSVESGIVDACEDDTPVDTDLDLTPDYRDLDSDDDGVPDALEGTGECDGDGKANYIDSFDDCGDRMDVPSTFSPNGDGVNDYWIIQGVRDFPNSELSVFNRWGNLVFSQKGYDNNWDGKASTNVLGDEDLPEGTYFYILTLDGSKALKGSVYIKR